MVPRFDDNTFDFEWVWIGKRSFARFFDLTIEEVLDMEKNANNIFCSMLEEMNESLKKHENFMVKVRRTEDKEIHSRLDILDL